MKNICMLLLFLVASIWCVSAQGSVELSLKILNNKGAALPNARIRLLETGINETLDLMTNANGQVTAILSQGKEWQLLINDFNTGRVIKVPEGGKSIFTVTETYNPEDHIRSARQTFDRANLKVVDQDIPVNTPFKTGWSCVEIKVENRLGIRQAKTHVYLLDTSSKIYYHAISDQKGIARFQVPSFSAFDVDVESVLNAGSADLPQSDGVIVTFTITYDRADLDERRSGDTIFQDLKGKQAVASGRSFYTLTVKKNGAPAPYETVYLKEINGKSIYCGKTDHKGQLNMLLPFGKRLMVHFNYQKDVDVIDLTRAYGQSSGYMTVKYLPDPKLEHPELFIPDSNALFLVDFENFLKKQYPKPQLPKNVNMVARFMGKVHADSREAVMEIGYTALGTAKNTPLNICFVIDVSGSMAGYYRLERLKSALAGLIEKLDPSTVLSIITFQSEMRVLLSPQILGNDKKKVIQLVTGLEAGGGTNMLQAMKKGYEFVASKIIAKGNNSIILLTDGYDENEVQVLVNAQKAFNKNIVCTTIGVGSDYNYALLKQLASNGRGLLHFVGEADDFNELFSTKLFSLLKPVATNVTLEIEFNKKIVFKHLYGASPVKSDTKFPRYQLPNLYNGSNHIALAKFDLVKPDQAIEKEAVIVRLSYWDEASGKKEVDEQQVFLTWELYTGMPELVADAEVKKLFCIAVINQGIKMMSDQYYTGHSKEAQETLERTRQQVIELYPKARDKDVETLMVSLDGYLEAFRNLAIKHLLEKKG